jgi:hypothetical protein
MKISWKMRWVEHVAFVGEMRNSYSVLVINLHGRHNLVDPSVDGRITFKQILMKHNGRCVLVMDQFRALFLKVIKASDSIKML